MLEPFFVRLVDLCLLGKGITVCAELSAKPLGTFPLLSSEKGSFCLQRQAAISLLRVCIVTYSGHGRETSILNLQIGLCFVPSGGAEGGPFQVFLQPFAKLYLDRQKGDFLLRGLLVIVLRTRPSSSACTRPVAMR